MSNRVTKVAVIGLGFMGLHWTRILTEHPNASVSVVSDINEELGREVADRFGARFVADPLEAASDQSVQGVVVATPEHLHVAPALAAIDSGRALLVEKPLAHTVEDAERIRGRALQAGSPVLVGHVLRFEPRYHAAHRAVAEGEIGAVQAIRSERVGLMGTHEIIQGRTTIGLYLGVHEFDLARWFAGDIASVAAHGSSGVVSALGYDVDDIYSVLLSFRSGAHGVATLGWIVPDAFPGRGLVTFTIVGEDGVIRIDQDQLGYSKVGHHGIDHVDFFFEGDVLERSYGALSIEADHFVRMIRGEEDPFVTVNDGTEAVRAALAVEQAGAKGAMLSLETVR